LRLQLQLDSDVADAIEAEVQKPYQEYQRKLEEYEATLVETITVEPNLSERTIDDLRDYQQHLGLRDEDVAPIEERIISQQKQSPSVEELPEPIQPNQLNQFEFDIVKVDAQGQITKRSRGQAEFFTEDLGNGVILEMVAIPGGLFLMGSPENEEGRSDSETPHHYVSIQPFFMGEFPITQAQWAAVAAFDKVNIYLNPDPSHFKSANRPVEQVSWDDAVEFCARLSKKTGKIYRLPSEAEWEYACRAGTTTPFYFGETITTELANYNGTYTYGSASKGEFRERTTDVGKFPANSFGLFDMHGNVLEWCQDEWHENYNNAPIDGSAWLSNSSNQYRLLHGGSWQTYPRNCRSANRNYDSRGFRNYDVGFRVVVQCGS
jgi:formylglycine-generating enzyme required for sulfatase activity